MGGDKARRAEQQRRNKIEFTTFTLRQRRRRRRRPLQPDAVGKKQQVGEEREYNQRCPVKRKRTFFCLVFLGEPPPHGEKQPNYGELLSNQSKLSDSSSLRFAGKNKQWWWGGVQRDLRFLDKRGSFLSRRPCFSFRNGVV